MNGEEIVLSNRLSTSSKSLAPRGLLEIGFRRRRVFGTCFLTLFLGAVLAAALLPRRYESEIKILLHRERADPLVTAEKTAIQETRPSLSEEDINSEVEILKSQDLLEKVVVSCSLQSKKGDNQLAVREATIKLGKDLRIEARRKSYIIAVTYSSTDPQLAARVLNTLGNLYLEKHVAVHRPNDAFGFFDRETERYRQRLEDAEKRLAEFNQSEEVVTAQSEKDSSIPKLAEFELSLRQTQAAIPRAEEHVRSLEALLNRTPARVTTQLHTTDNGALLQQLTSSLVALETQRTDLLTKYAPDDRMVQGVQTQIDQVRAAIDAQKKAPLREETTDQSATHEFLRQELAKAKAELASLRALAASSQRVDQSYRSAVIERDRKQLQQQALIRDVKAAEANYLLYQNKREEAGISNAFDQNRILNVSIAEAAMVPIRPSNPASIILALGAIFAGFVSAGAIFVQEYMDSSLHTPEQVEAYLDVPVLASLPRHGEETGGSVVL